MQKILAVVKDGTFYKIWHPTLLFSSDELHIVLKRRNLQAFEFLSIVFKFVDSLLTINILWVPLQPGKRLYYGQSWT